MPANKSVIVIGAGISGLSCAYRLFRRGIDVTLLDASETSGGLISSEREGGFLFEFGPQSFQLTASLHALIRELHLESELQTADPRAPRYVLRRGRLEKIPMSPPAVLASQFLSLGSRWKIASEGFRRTKSPAEEESVAAFVRRKFGHEILEYLVSPFVSGVYAGDPERLSLKAAFPTLEAWEREYGSVIRGARKSRSAAGGAKTTAAPSLCSFTQGVSVLTRSMAEQLGVRYESRTKALSLAPLSREFELKTASAGRNDDARLAGAVVVATPAYAAAEILTGFLPTLAEALSGIAYAPVAVVAAGYPRKHIAYTLDGFGFLVPRVEKTRTLGTVFNSSLFAGRAPEDTVLLTSFLGGATDLDIVKFSDADISKVAHDDNARILGIFGAPGTTRVRKWSRALPQYNLGHGHVVTAIRSLQSETPGLFLAGNYLDGPALGKCVENGAATGDAVEAFLKS